MFFEYKGKIMGLFINNIHVKNENESDFEKIKKYFVEKLKNDGYREADNEENPDISLVIYKPENGRWISVASDTFDFSTEEKIEAVSKPLAKEFHNDILTAVCVDSDYLFLNLTKADGSADGCVSVGKSFGKKIRKDNLSPWKNSIDDFDKFKKAVKKNYDFAEDAFVEAANLLGMDEEQALLTTDALSNTAKNAAILKFCAPLESVNLPKLAITQFSLMPLKIDSVNGVFAVNKGGKSKGIAVIILGDFVKNDEITFENVTFDSEIGTNERKSIPVTFRKTDSANGEKILYWENRDFTIPQAVDVKIPEDRRIKLEFERSFGIRFTPKGNSGKILDVKVCFAPLNNFKNGQCIWYVYKLSGSKAEYIRSTFGRFNELNPKDYDLD